MWHPSYCTAHIAHRGLGVSAIGHGASWRVTLLVAGCRPVALLWSLLRATCHMPRVVTHTRA